MTSPNHGTTINGRKLFASGAAGQPRRQAAAPQRLSGDPDERVRPESRLDETRQEQLSARSPAIAAAPGRLDGGLNVELTAA